MNGREHVQRCDGVETATGHTIFNIIKGEARNSEVVRVCARREIEEERERERTEKVTAVIVTTVRQAESHLRRSVAHKPRACQRGHLETAETAKGVKRNAHVRLSECVRGE